MARRSGLSRRIQVPRRSRTWSLGPGGTGVTVFTASSVAILGSGVTPVGTESTLARTRGLLEIFLTGATSAGDGFQGAFGIGKATAAAFTVGVTAIPTPITEVAWDGWLYHRFISLHAPATVSAGVTPAVTERIEIDSKAMRKITDEEVFFAAVEFTEIGAATMHVFFDCRMLELLA